jgi:hypothetical protein
MNNKRKKKVNELLYTVLLEISGNPVVKSSDFHKSCVISGGAWEDLGILVRGLSFLSSLP